MVNNTKVDWQLISREDFKAYECVRASGVTNMWDVSVVEDLSGLDRDTIHAIMGNYHDLNIKYPGVRKAR
mgnify:CR=1 FL=1